MKRVILRSTLLLLLALVISSMVFFVFFDYRELHLKHVGTMQLTPHIETIMDNETAIVEGTAKEIQDRIDLCLFDGMPGCKQWKQYPTTSDSSRDINTIDVMITWTKKPTFDNSKRYILCYNCKINLVMYYYHSKFINHLHINAFIPKVLTVSPLPEDESIRVYEVDRWLYVY